MSYSAILLVGGMGTRLHPLTKATPKPMLNVAGVPFIEHQIVRARESGVSEIILATSFLAELFQPYFGDGTEFGISIKYSIEEAALGTGGAIRHASNLLTGSGPVVIFNGDVLSGHDLAGQIEFHINQEAEVTLYLTTVPDARAYGAVELSGDRVIAFNEKMANPPTNTINAGCYIFNREVIQEIPDGKVVSVERETFPQLLADSRRVFGFVDDSYWLDIGTPSALVKASQDLVLGHIVSAATPAHLGDSLVAFGATVGEGSKITGGSVIGKGAVVESGCVIEGSNVGAGAVIGSGTVLRNSFVANDCQVPSGTLGNSCFLGF